MSPAAERPPAVGAAAGPERAEQRDPLLDLARAMPAGGWTPRPRTHPKAAALVHVLPRLLSEVPDGPLHTFLAGLVARHAASGLPKGFVVPTWVITVVAPAQAENEREPGSLPTVDWATLTPIGRAEATKAGCVIDVPRLPDRVAEPEPGARAWVDAVVAHVGKHAADPYVEEPKPLGSACLAIPFATTAQTARRRLAVRGTVIVQRLTTTWANAPWTVVLSLASHAATHLTVCDPDQGQPHPPVVRLDPEASTTAILAGGPERSLAARVLATAMRAHPERFQS